MGNPNEIKLEHDIIVITLHGKQTFEIADKTYKSVRAKIQKLKLQKKPVHILCDLTDLNGHDAAARTRIKAFFRLDYDKLAYYGARSYVQNLVLYLAGSRNSRVRPFKNKAQSVAWLTDGKEPLFSIKEPDPSSSRVLLLMTCLTGVVITLVTCAKLYQNSASVSQRQAAHSALYASDAAEAKINAYLNTLYGFRSFFAVSITVNQADFHRYFTHLKLSERLPGITAIAYVREVPAADKQAVIDEIRSDTSLPNTSLGDFTIKNDKQQLTYYPIVYLEPLPKTPASFGYDLSTYPGRVDALQQARRTGNPVASDTYSMMRAGKTSKERGFIITIPVTLASSTEPSGYINAIFDYNELFAKTRPLANDSFKIINHSQHAVYSSATVKPSDIKIASENIPVADKNWQLTLYGDRNYGLSSLESSTPWVTLAIGLTITGLVTFVLSNILRSRQAAFELAHYITEDLRVSEHKQDLMIDSVKDYAIYMLDQGGRVMTWNSGAALILQYKASEILGRHYSIFLHPGERRAATKQLKRAAEEGRTEAYGWRVRKDKSEFWAHITLSAIRDESGELLGYTKLTQDLTKQRQLEQERESFVAIATHELKTPITSIKAYAQVLQQRFIRAGDERSAELLGRMDTQANKLTLLVGDLLDVSKIETGRLEYDIKPFDFNALVHILAEEVGRTSSQHKITITGKIDRPVIGDEYRIGQIITNLLENAIKYSPKATKINVSLRTYRQSTELRVRDFGPGISQQDQPRIFERFYRTESGKLSSGFGLGLYISSEIAKTHGGSLTVRSTLGRGSTFTLRLPTGNIKNDDSAV